MNNQYKTSKIYTSLSIVLIVLLFLLSGCKSKTIYVPVESVKTEYKDRVHRDSILLYDSIFVDRYMRGDTVFLFKEKYKYTYKDKLIRDSVFINDSIRVPFPVIEYKDVNRLNSFQSFQIWCGRILLLLIIGYAGFKYLRK